MSAQLAIQLYAVRGECEKSLAAALRDAAAHGYAGAEPWGHRGDAPTWRGLSGRDLRRLFDDAGIRCCGFHVATEALVGDNLARSIELNQALGNRFLVIAADKQRMSSAAGIDELARILTEADRRLAPLGMFCGYHAHSFDFASVDGAVAWESLFARLPDRVIMQLDTGNCVAGGGDPLATLRRFPGRARSVHLKDHGVPEGGALGDGTIDFAQIIRICRELHPTEWFVVEEGEHAQGWDIAARSRAYLRTLGL